MTDFRDATVTSVAPLLVQLDGDEAGAILAPDSLLDVAVLTVADRVRCELSQGRVIIHGKSNASFYSQTQVNALITSAVAASTKNARLLLNGAFRQNQRGYISATALAAGAYCFDRWRDGRVVNLDNNPRFENASLAWTVAGTGAAGTRITTRNHSLTGSASMSVSQTGTTDSYMKKDYTGLTIGKFYTFSVWAYITAAGSQFVSGRTVLLTDVGGTVPVGTGTVDQTKLNQWQRIYVTTTVPITTTALTVRLYGYMSNSSAIVFDDVLMTEGTVLWPEFCGADTDCAWSGTADASTSTYGSATAASLTFTGDPHGQTVTLNSGGRIQQILERTNLPAGTYVLAWDGTSTARVYNSNTAIAARPAFAASGLTVTLDGLADVVIEFTAAGGAKTIGNARMFGGTIDYGFTASSFSDELRACQRYYWRSTALAQAGTNTRFAHGAQFATTSAEFVVWPPATMHHPPFIEFSGVGVANNSGGSTVTTLNMTTNANSAGPYTLNATFSAVGSANEPAVLYAQTASAYLALSSELT